MARFQNIRFSKNLTFRQNMAKFNFLSKFNILVNNRHRIYIKLDKNIDIVKKSNFGQKWPDFKKVDLVRKLTFRQNMAKFNFLFKYIILVKNRHRIYIILEKNTDIVKKSNFSQKWPDFKKFDLVRNCHYGKIWPNLTFCPNLTFWSIIDIEYTLYWIKTLIL